MKLTSKINMDLLAPGVTPIVSAVQEDRCAREIAITLTAGGKYWKIPAAARALIRFRKSDGRGGTYDTMPDGSRAWTAEGNVLTVQLAPQVLTMPGFVNLTVSLVEEDRQISTFGIRLQVCPAAKGGKLESGDYENITGFPRFPGEAAPGQLLQVAEVDSSGCISKLTAVDNPCQVSQVPVAVHTNRIPLSVDENGGIFNGCGWMGGKSLNSDGSLMDNVSTFVSGFIPVKPGDVIRILDPGREEFGRTLILALYDANKTITSGIGKNPNQILNAANQDLGALTISGNLATWTLSPLNYWFWRNFAWLRVTTFSADSIVTVNEEIVWTTAPRYSLNPGIKITRENLDFELPGLPLSGKTVALFGDSIFGFVRDSSSVAACIAGKTGASVVNAGFGGCRMARHPMAGYAAFSMWALADALTSGDWSLQEAQCASGDAYFREHLDNLRNLDFTKVDMAVIHFGANDYTGGVALENPDDPMDCATLCGAARYSLEKLLAARPDLRIFLSLPAYRFWPDTGEYPENHTNSLGLQLADYAQALRTVAREYHIPVLESCEELGISRANIANLTLDGAHHNAAGRKILGQFLAGRLMAD